MPDPVLVTGAAGFAGSHLVDLLASNEPLIVAWYRPGGRRPPAEAPRAPREGTVTWQAVDLLDPQAVERALAAAHPRIIYHLAGAAHVGHSWEQSGATLEINVRGTHHLLEAVRRLSLPCQIFIPGSAYVYRQSEAALREEDPIGPTSPYGFSKLAQERLGCRAVTEDGQAVFVARAFNHLGPRQEPSFVASGFARQIALIETGRAEPVVRVGNLDARRDLTDVRDTVRAYRAIVERGRPGRLYNVCSGRTYAVRELVERLVNLAEVRVRVEVDPARLRPSDVPVLWGDPRRIREEIGWLPEISLDRSLRDLLDFWRAAVRQEHGSTVS